MVRIWCVPVKLLDRQHLLGEHVELHIIWNAILKERAGIKAGWQKHPETKKFRCRLYQLFDRHNQQVFEMKRRGYQHNSPLNTENAGNVDFGFYEYSEEEYDRDLAVLQKRNGLNRKS